MTQPKTQQLNPQIFTIYSDEITERLDPYFYKFEFREIEKILSSKRTVEFLDLINSVSMGASVPKYREEKDEVPFVFGKNVKHGFLDLADVEYISEKTAKKFKSSILEEKDLVFSVRGAYIGKVAIIPKRLKGGNIINNLVRINLKDKNLAEYLTIYLSSKIGQDLIDREVWGGAQPGITNEQIKNLKIILPPLQIQTKIAGKVKFYYSQTQKLREGANNNLQTAKEKVEEIILR
ncbi:MAG: restriction endonuclease subunit S [bacterium]